MQLPPELAAAAGAAVIALLNEVRARARARSADVDRRLLESARAEQRLAHHLDALRSPRQRRWTDLSDQESDRIRTDEMLRRADDERQADVERRR